MNLVQGSVGNPICKTGQTTCNLQKNAAAVRKRLKTVWAESSHTEVAALAHRLMCFSLLQNTNDHTRLHENKNTQEALDKNGASYIIIVTYILIIVFHQ